MAELDEERKYMNIILDFNVIFIYKFFDILNINNLTLGELTVKNAKFHVMWQNLLKVSTER